MRLVPAFFLCILAVGRCLDAGSNLVNVALRGRALQSSTSHGRNPAGNAIDGSRAGALLDGSCAQTDQETNPWWRLDLLEVHTVTSVTITNRADCCPERINGAEIRIGNSLERHGNSNPRCTEVVSIPAGGSTTFKCHGMEGRYVNVFLRGYRQSLTLCEVEVLANPTPAVVETKTPTPLEFDVTLPQTENVALDKAATQSSQYNYLGSPGNAVDGKHSSWYSEHSCSRTKTQTDPWWTVDLQQEYQVSTVTITNTEDGHPDIIDGAQILIGNSMENNGRNNPLCAVLSSFPAWESQTFSCRAMWGRYVTISLPGCDKQLSLCEVEVNATTDADKEASRSSDVKHSASERHREGAMNFGSGQKCPDFKTVDENAATGGSATQSSQLDGLGGAENAIDRNRSTLYAASSCSHTKVETDPWWRVDLGTVHNVTFVSVTNRGDCCSERISGAEIHVGNSLENHGNSNPLCAVIPYIPTGQIRTFRCGGIEGRYVNIALPGRERSLTLCEVEVLASTFHPATITEDPSKPLPNPYLAWLWSPWQRLNRLSRRRANVALLGRATQSSQLSRLTHAENAIDGRLDAEYLAGSCSHTRLQSDPWWRVDLLQVHSITSVTVTNREDCCPWRLDGAEILVGNSLVKYGNSNPVCAVISSIPAGESVTFQCHGMEGRYINIIRPGCFRFLSLCEVEVDATPVAATKPVDQLTFEEEPQESQCSAVQIPENLASAGTATQSSQYDHLGNASNAIDRNRNPLYHAGSCSHTQSQTDPWWRVDLGGVYSVTTVTVTNRGDCCSERLEGAEIRVGDSLSNDGNSNPLCAVVPEVREGQSITLQCRGRTGRYVNIVLPGKRKSLTLCEVDIHGSIADPSKA